MIYFISNWYDVLNGARVSNTWDKLVSNSTKLFWITMATKKTILINKFLLSSRCASFVLFLALLALQESFYKLGCFSCTASVLWCWKNPQGVMTVQKLGSPWSVYCHTNQTLSALLFQVSHMTSLFVLRGTVHTAHPFLLFKIFIYEVNSCSVTLRLCYDISVEGLVERGQSLLNMMCPIWKLV